MRALPSWILPALIAAALLVGGSLAYQHFANRGVDPAVHDSLAVLQASKRPDSIAHAQLAAKAETVYVASQARSDSSRVIAQHAAAAHQQAAAAAQAARESRTARDSALHWFVAYQEEQRRGDSLDAALEVERRASESARASAMFYRQADSVHWARLERVERLNASLAGEVDRLAGGCRLLPFVPCPSRTATAIGSAALTFVAVRKLNGRPIF